MLAPVLPTIIAVLADGHTFNGANVWLKPLHFQLALAIHMATLAILMPVVSPAWQNTRLLRWPLLAASASAMLELGYIMLQAARGRASHFNQETGLEIALYGLMGIGSLMLVAAPAMVGIAIWRSVTVYRDSQVRLGAAIGLILGSALTLAVAGYMSTLTTHLASGPQTDAFGLPFLGWATRGGDLRVPHFFATHMMQALPLAGLAADRLGWRQAWLMPLLATIYLIAVLSLFGEALAGIPFIKL